MEGAKGFILAAASSNSGKTLLTLGLLRAFKSAGVSVIGCKAGPDYIDPTLHRVACGQDSWNLDSWAMAPSLIADILFDSSQRTGATGAGGLVLVEGVMGLFDGADGADGGGGSTASLAVMSGLPVVLVVDVKGQGQSVAAIARGFMAEAEAQRSAIGAFRIVGVIANRVGSDRHRGLIARALAPTGLPLLGAVREDKALRLPSRHLGLVPAGEIRASLDGVLSAAEECVREGVDLDALYGSAGEISRSEILQSSSALEWPLPHGVIGVARDDAFVFAYPHILAGWRNAGAELRFFSPLANESPPAGCGFIFLPGGYPELHGAALARADRFRRGLTEAAAAGIEIYGECGGYMALGRSLTDAEGVRHEMVGLLPIETSFSEPQLHLGYRSLYANRTGGEGWLCGREWRGHEFHYARCISEEEEASSLFLTQSSDGAPLPAIGQLRGSVYGSFAHIISPH
ncbi:MAG: cobyrinate a,c-diamide synthase [Alphaproteobacteria bacterium]